MARFTHTVIDDMESIWGGSYKRARATLGVTAFGMSVIDLPPNFDHVPAHVHTADGQEELYIPLAGDGWFEVDGERVPVDTETALRVGPDTKRRPVSGPNGMRLLAIGGIVGKPYETSIASPLGADEVPVTELPATIAAATARPVHDFIAKRFGEMESFQGKKGVSMIAVRRSMGIASFGANVSTIDPVEDHSYPLHDHAADGQEEVYIPISGSGWIELGDERVAIAPGEMVRVAPEVKRRLDPGPEGLRTLVLGGVPGQAYPTPS